MVYVVSNLMAHARLANILETNVLYVRLVPCSDSSSRRANFVSSDGEVRSFFSHGIILLAPEGFYPRMLTSNSIVPLPGYSKTLPKDYALCADKVRFMLSILQVQSLIPWQSLNGSKEARESPNYVINMDYALNFWRPQP